MSDSLGAGAVPGANGDKPVQRGVGFAVMPLLPNTKGGLSNIDSV